MYGSPGFLSPALQPHDRLGRFLDLDVALDVQRGARQIERDVLAPVVAGVVGQGPRVVDAHRVVAVEGDRAV